VKKAGCSPPLRALTSPSFARANARNLRTSDDRSSHLLDEVHFRINIAAKRKVMMYYDFDYL
jgi:hypothetical protein